jgi:hypothetical protein
VEVPGPSPRDATAWRNRRVVNGSRVLLILVSTRDSREVGIFEGVARWTAFGLELVSDSATVPVLMDTLDVEQSSFAASVLPHLVGEERYLPLAEKLTREVDLCLPRLVDGLPAGVLHTPGFIGSLATGPHGRLFLMQVR